MKPEAMEKHNETELDDDMRGEYDPELFKHGVRGKYADELGGEVVMVKLDADVAQAYPDAQAVNDALRLLMRIAGRVPHEPTEQRKSA